ncbi:hypothetical protein EDF88_0989 [Buttiauxella sp. BIGb0552]|uniref:hypothetical protein n=1 Tax=Buttiauxella sp. BIGb0552 TaxID=2485120 RepID=UPI0010DCC36D|nr:hypothetical protein [Buttiauxella sp. BIGb0552]TDX18503.1 hypothetical protein EDF88_0989 [Buttiauxella sp. BIGb0552]
MLSTYERWVSFFDFAFKPTHAAAPDIPITETLKRLKLLVDAGNAVKLYNVRTRAVRITEMTYNEGDTEAVLLLQLCDQNGSDPVFGELNTGNLRVEPKLAGEGIAVSSHIIISTAIVQHTADHHKTLVESVPGISKSIIEPFLNALLREAFVGQEFKNPATKAMCRLRPKLEILSHGSQTLLDTLNGARLHNVKLVSTRKLGGMDKTAYTELSERSVRYKIIKQPPLQDKKRLLEILRKKGQQSGYTKVSISYSKDGRQASLDLDRNEDAATKLFTKSEKVLLGSGINQCESTIHPELETKMKGLL